MSITSFLSHHKQYIKSHPEYYVELKKLVDIIKDNDIELPEINDCQKTPESLIKLKKLLYDHSINSYILSSFKYLNVFQPIDHVNEDPKKDLFYIKEHELVSSCVFNTEYIKFIFDCTMYDPNTNQTFDFGQFKIDLLSNDVYVNRHKDNHIVGSYYHPYVSESGCLCLGGFREAYKKLWRSLEFASCFDIVVKILTVHGINHEMSGQESDPHALFSKWLGNICHDCDSVMSADKTILCGKSNVMLCEECANSQTDEVSNIAYSAFYIDECEVCDKRRLDVKKFKGKKVCISCRAITHNLEEVN